MIIDYDRNPSANTDQKLQSLMESIQLALNELTTDMDILKKKIQELEESIGD